MAEAIIEADAGRKRRLPTWMLGVSAADRQPGSSSMLFEKQSGTQADRGTLVPERDGSKRAGKSQKDEAKQRTRKASRRDDDPSDSVVSCDEAVLRKKKLKKEGGGRQKRDASTKKNHRSRGTQNSEVEAESQGSGDDEVELTVEDLVSIAEKYVNAEKQKQPGRTQNETTGCSIALARGISSRRETVMKKKEIPSAEIIATNITRTGDAAQDMLDLFLGPLLKRPPTVEQEDLRMRTEESLYLAPESKVQSSSMSEWNEEAPVAKKKSSLKDKVSVFFK